MLASRNYDNFVTQRICKTKESDGNNMINMIFSFFKSFQFQYFVILKKTIDYK